MKRLWPVALTLWAGCRDFDADIAKCIDAGACVASLDAGEDAGRDVDAGFDAGVADAGAQDAGFDAGTPDAGIDGGTPDAGVDAGVDAGPVYTLRSTRFAPLTPIPYDGGTGGYRLIESTLAVVGRSCSTDGGVCVTGGLEP